MASQVTIHNHDFRAKLQTKHDDLDELDDDEKPREECGVFGYVTRRRTSSSINSF